MKYDFNEKDLTSEKSLLDVFKLTLRLKPSNFQVFIIIIVFLLLSTNVFIFKPSLAIILKDTREWATLGFNFSITTLGFLIAGFTIFATLSKPTMMLAMMDHINPETKLPTLKYNFFAFMKVFIAYIIFAIIYLSIMLFGQSGGFLAHFIALFPNAVCLKFALISCAYVIVGSSFIYLLLLLQTYIFNIYAIVMNSLRWEYGEEVQRELEKNKG